MLTSFCAIIVGVTVCDDKLFVVGGWSGCNGHSACEMYDPKVGQWQAIAELNLGW